MSDQTKIEWADASFSPWIGCTKVSPGCQNCYASTYGRRFGVEWGPGKKRRRTSAATWRQVERWDQKAHGAIHRPRVFPSLCDPFDPEVPVAWLADYLDLIRRTPNLDHLLLTKRPEHVWSRLQAIGFAPKSCAWKTREVAIDIARCWYGGVYLPNLWLGVSAEDQKRWDERVPVLLSIPARVRFVSAEPMLGPIDFTETCHQFYDRRAKGGLHWIIFGGESGPKARPCSVEWIRDGLRQCREAGVAAFVKQLGAKPRADVMVKCDHPVLAGMVGVENRPLILRDRKGGDMSEWPEDLRVRQEPQVSHD